MISYAEMHEVPDLSQEAFGGDVIDSLESYDFDIDDETEWAFAGDDMVSSSSDEDAKKPVFPYDRNEPQLADEVVMELDSIADRVELTRLKNMGVPLDTSGLESGSYKQLSTRFVRAWRDKEMEIDGKPSGSEDLDLLQGSSVGFQMTNKACSDLLAVQFFLRCFCSTSMRIGFSCHVTCRMRF